MPCQGAKDAYTYVMESEGAATGIFKIRESLVAGLFYPDDPQELSKAIDLLVKESGRVRMDAAALIVPHASLPFSGLLQARALSAARSRRIKTIVLLGPRHRPDESAVFLPESGIFRTPLGDLSVDAALAEELESCGTFFAADDIPHLEEHAIEVQLPFIQRLYPEAAILPLILSSLSAGMVERTAACLDMVLEERLKETLLVAVSNLGQSALTFPLVADPRTMDPGVPGGNFADEACGIDCIRVLRGMACLENLEMEELGRSDSRKIDPQGNWGDQAGQDARASVVEYGAFAFYPVE
jgi:hypothetical protein